MSGNVMMFPDTVEEFMEQNKVVDREQVYSNGIEFVPIFRMQQWFDHVKHSPDDARPVGKWIPIMTELEYECSRCKKKLDDYINASEWAGLSEIPNYCPNCGAKIEEVN